MRKLSFRFITFCLLLFTFSALSAEIAAQNKKDMNKAKKLVSEGDKSFNKRDYEGAIKKYSEAIALVDNYAAAHFWKGNAHYYLKQNDLALEELNKGTH